MMMCYICWCFSDFITYIPRSKSTIRMLISKDGGFSTTRYLSIEKAVQSWHERNWHSYNELMWIHLHRCYIYIPCPNPFILSINWLNFRRVFDKSLADTSDPTTMWLCRFQGKKMAWFAKFAVIDLMFFTISWRKRAGTLEVSILFVYSGWPVVHFFLYGILSQNSWLSLRGILTNWPQKLQEGWFKTRWVTHLEMGCFWVFP